MPKTFLCSAGTSIAQGCNSLAAFQRRRSSWDEDTRELRNEIDGRLARLDLRNASGLARTGAQSP